MQSGNFPALAQAEALLDWAHALNPGPWVAHSRTAARAAHTIAAHCGLDAEYARVLGLMHDIGRYEGVRGLHHVVAGHALALERGWPGVARICLTHSFPVRDVDSFAGAHDCSPQERAMLRTFIAHAEYDEYDALIQLCDALAMPGKVVLIDCRLVDVALRHGINDFTLRRFRAYHALKARFDALCGTNIYSLFGDEVVRSALS